MGDVIELCDAFGVRVKLIHGDAMRELPNISGVDVVITDPPYKYSHLGGGGCFADRNVSRGGLDHIADGFDVERSFDLWLQLGAKNIVTFCSNEQVELILAAARTRGMLSTVMVWWKFNPIPFTNNTWLPDVEFFIHSKVPGAYMNNDVEQELKSRVRRRPRCTERDFSGDGLHLHPTAKPVDIIKQLVEVLSKEGQTILDPYMGSGTTGVAAVEMKRNFIGIELEPAPPNNFPYFELAKKRVLAVTSQTRLF